MRPLRTALCTALPAGVAIVLLAIGGAGAAVAQDGTVAGRVLDARTGDGVPGASVVLQGTALGAAADVDGAFRFTAPAGTYTAVATAVGYARATQPVAVAAGATATVTFRLGEDAVGLDEVLVTGTGAATTRRQTAIDVETVGGDQLQSATTSSLDAALAGKIAGAQITQNAKPGGASQIILRGINTIGSTTPLILLDGVPINTDVNGAGQSLLLTGFGGSTGTSRLGDIDFTTVERVEVVKGAAASALYGAQGANGVIQLFSKRGQAGRPRVTATTSLGASQFVRGRIGYSDLHSYATDGGGNITGLSRADQVWSQASQQTAAGSVRDKQYRLGGAALPLYDNIGTVFESALTTNNALSLSGGTDALTYVLAGNAVRQGGVEKATGFWRNSFSIGLGSQLRRNLRLDARTNLINSQTEGGTITGNHVESSIGAALSLPRFVDVTERDSLTGLPLGQQQAGQTSNSPLFTKAIFDRNSELVRAINSFGVNYRPFSFLELDYKAGLDHYRNNYREVQRNVEDIPETRRGPVLVPEGSVDYVNYKNTNANTNASAFLRLGLGRLPGTRWALQSQTQVAFDWRREIYQWIQSTGTGLPRLPGLVTLAAVSEQDVNEYRSTFVTYGLLANQKVDVGDVGGFSFGGRIDQSSAFREGEGTEFFPRADAYVRLGALLPASARRPVSELKLRAAYGSAGTQPGPYDRIITLAQTSVGNTGVLTSQGTLPNPALTVERSTEFEAGVDLGLRLGRRLFSSVGVNATVWNRRSDNVLFEIDVAPSTGASKLLTNGYAIDSDGIDLSVNALAFSTRRFTWNAGLTLGTQRSVVAGIASGEDVVIVQNQMPFILSRGQSVGAHYGYRAVRSLDEVNPLTGNRYVAAADEYRYGFVDGRVVNVATQQVLWRSQQEVIGDATPDFTLGFRNDVTLWGRLTLGVQLDWVHGPDLYNATRQSMYQVGLHEDNDDPVLIRGAVPGPDGTTLLPVVTDAADPALVGQTVDAPLAWASYYNSLYKTRDKNEAFVEDGSFVKLRELSVGYDVTPLLRRLRPGLVDRVTLTFAGRNLLTFSKYSGFDPEVNQGGTSAVVRGYDYYTYPNFRTYTFGATITL